MVAVGLPLQHRAAQAATADPKGAAGIPRPVDGRVHLAHSLNAAHFTRDEWATVRRLARAVPAAGPATYAGTPLSNNPGGEL